MTGKRPFRCHICGWRGWFEELELRFPSSAQKPLPPEVAGTDVPIPDFVLDDVRPLGLSSTLADTGEQPEPRIKGERDGGNPASPANGMAIRDKSGSRRGQFAMLGMEIQTPATPASGASGEIDGGNGKHRSGQDRSGANATQEMPGESAHPETAKAKRDQQADNVIVLPPAFDEYSGRPVSNKVTAAFHHEARNKSMSCPKCGEFVLYRSRARTLGESLKKRLTSKRPYRCHRCGWRGWLTK